MKFPIMRIHLFSLTILCLFSTYSFAGKKTVVKTKTVTECDELGENCKVIVDSQTCRGANCASPGPQSENVYEPVEYSYTKVDYICPKRLSENTTIYRLPSPMNTCLKKALARKLEENGFSVDTDSFTDFEYEEYSLNLNNPVPASASGVNDGKDRGSESLKAEVLIKADGKEILADTRLRIDFDYLFFQFSEEEIKSDSLGNVTSRTPLEDFILIPNGAVFEIFSLPRDLTASDAVSVKRNIPTSGRSVGMSPISIEDAEMAACTVGDGVDESTVNIPYYGEINGFKVVPQVDRLEEDTNCYEQPMPMIMLPPPTLPAPQLKQEK